MVGSIDPRCETVRGTHWPKGGRRLCLELASRKTILASGKTQPHQQAGHMDASDPIKPEKTLVAWGPSTYGSSTEGRQEPLTVGAACGLGAGLDHRGTGPDAGSDRAAAVGRSWAEDFGGRGSSLLQAARDHLQKNPCTPPNRIGRTYPRLANAGRQARRALTPPSWCSSTRRAPTPRWSASTDDVEGASGSSARPRGVIGRPQPSPAACAATVWSRPGTVWSRPGCWKVP